MEEGIEREAADVVCDTACGEEIGDVEVREDLQKEFVGEEGEGG
jgi:hypothetical protein